MKNLFTMPMWGYALLVILWALLITWFTLYTGMVTVHSGFIAGTAALPAILAGLGSGLGFILFVGAVILIFKIQLWPRQMKWTLTFFPAFILTAVLLWIRLS